MIGDITRGPHSHSGVNGEVLDHVGQRQVGEGVLELVGELVEAQEHDGDDDGEWDARVAIFREVDEGES